ncbi:hypothetical protein [Streptomyces sp. NBC_00338]|uniref:hypothetical protein n=1 Tax=Streptomyces sp. NBC_00338 TaxID=2975715 RepID=UPI002255B75E|nr:hypothetical protein [Streptomyces sp. NBC_00338]MCX5144656.1 hypothetical protein [Streptomyces sp. NBC_00338]MCX5145048.1 hypothetical protein [Streptomyces sp. NBC_00338]
MDSQQILGLYTWKRGACFRHPEAGEVDTTVVQELHTRGGDVEGIRACQACILAMEERRRGLAAEAGVAYEPGHAGAPL